MKKHIKLFNPNGVISINTREVAAEYRLAHWAQAIQARVSSGQSIKAYCEAAGISKNTYFYWQRKLREAACNELVNRECGIRDTIIPNNPDGGFVCSASTPQGWARLEQAVALKSTWEESTLAIDINGCRVLVADDADLERLAKVCRALKAI